ncbi:MAG TPA: hypothetical protein VFN48_05430 [Solirubrobacteraceae bacterium]|nr:hypothetical protein [Solirubrobacteraceae bacterium]
MGVLDDAIREHLDLKRRRGADPAEIERLEREALGPVRREPTAFTEAAADPHPFPDEDIVTDVAAAGPSTADHLELASADPLDQPTLLDSAVIDPEDDAAASRAGAAAGPARPGIAAPDYDHPDLDEFSAASAPGTSAMEPEPAAPVLHPESDADGADTPEEPRHRRRGLFSRFTHSHDADDGPEFAPIHDGGADDPLGEPDFAPAERLPALDETQVRPPAGSAPGAPASPPPLQIQPEPESDPGLTVEYDVERHFAEEDAGAPRSRRPAGDPAAGAPAPGAPAPGAEPEAATLEEDEDILEETPDFLADTPDHDRLWFEQKPPPDFDFER